MNLKSLDVVSLRDAVVGEFTKFATSSTRIFADDIWRQVEAIYTERRYWPDPLIQINPSDQRSPRANALAPGSCIPIRRQSSGLVPVRSLGASPLSRYRHQEQAIALAAHVESYVVTTGSYVLTLRFS